MDNNTINLIEPCDIKWSYFSSTVILRGSYNDSRKMNLKLKQKLITNMCSSVPQDLKHNGHKNTRSIKAWESRACAQQYLAFVVS